MTGGLGYVTIVHDGEHRFVHRVRTPQGPDRVGPGPASVACVALERVAQAASSDATLRVLVTSSGIPGPIVVETVPLVR